MKREEAISEWTFRSNHIKKWLDKYGEEPSIRHYVELIDMAIEALKADAVQIHDDGTLEVKVPNAHKVGRVLVMDTDSHIGGGLFYPDDAEPKWNCTANFIAEQLDRLRKMTDEEKLEFLKRFFGMEGDTE